MSITGYLVPFPDPGAWDLMSDRLEEQLHAPGPGAIRIRLTLPPIPPERADSQGGFARKRVLLARQEESGWATLYDATTASRAPTEELLLPITAAATLRCRLMNMGGLEGQFTLDCAFIPA